MNVIPSLLFDFHNDCIDIDGNIILKKIYSLDELEEYKNSVIGPRVDLENELGAKVRAREDRRLEMPGYSDTAGSLTNFVLDLNYSDGHTPNFRERLVCPITELNNRQRFAASYTKKMVAGHDYSSVFIFEQSTPVFRHLSHSLSRTNIIGSEYLGIDFEPGRIVNGIRHEDTLNLSFNAESFDMVFSSEVLNRTPDLAVTIRETHRILKKGGRFIFSTPFSLNARESRQRALLTEGGVRHLEEARYYQGQHTRDQQSPIFYDLGWDLFDIIKECAFKNAYLLCYYSVFYGYLGEGLQSIFVAEK